MSRVETSKKRYHGLMQAKLNRQVRSNSDMDLEGRLSTHTTSLESPLSSR